MKLIGNTTRKLSDNKGESIAEVLVAVLIASLAIVALLTMVTASERILNKSSESYAAKIADRNCLETLLSWFGTQEDEKPADYPDSVTEGSTVTENTATVIVSTTDDNTNAVDIGLGFEIKAKTYETNALYNGSTYYVFCEKTD